MKVTIRDVAAAAGVSIATVSRVFNRNPGVNPELRRKIVATARTLGYKSFTGRLRSVAVILPDYEGMPLQGYIGLLLQPLVNELFLHGYHLELIPEREIDLINNEMFCAAVSLLFYDDLAHSWDRNFSVPLICVNTPGNNLNGIYSVSSNEEQGISLAVKYLQRYNHVNIGLLTHGSDKTWCNRERNRAFFRLVNNPTSIRHCTDYIDIYENMSYLLRRGITAIISPGENYGIILNHIATNCKCRIPEDLSIICYESESISPYCHPPQTTIAQNFNELSRKTVGLLDRLTGKTSEVPTDVVVDYNLIERDSVAKI